jgi:TDG/mug DNA glycosylase family protein
MDAETVRIYEHEASAWARARSGRRPRDVAAFRDAIEPGAVRADLGSGPGRVTEALGAPVLALDAAFAMLVLAREAAPSAWPVQADLEALPLRPQSLGAGWAQASYLHVPRARLPMALAQLHRAMRPGAPFELAMKRGDYSGHALAGDDFPGRFFATWEPEPLDAVVTGAGFDLDATEADEQWIRIRATRARTLPDFVGPGLHLLVCGLNPSLRSADVGLGYAGPSNRFWVAAVDARLVTVVRDPWRALSDHGLGMTDLVKRATVGAAELRAAEYRSGSERVTALVRWLQPAAICFVGLAGYRVAIDRQAQPGPQVERFGGVPTYVMPSTSGLNARTSRAELADHLRAARDLGARDGS